MIFDLSIGGVCVFLKCKTDVNKDVFSVNLMLKI